MLCITELTLFFGSGITTEKEDIAQWHFDQKRSPNCKRWRMKWLSSLRMGTIRPTTPRLPIAKLDASACGLWLKTLRCQRNGRRERTAWSSFRPPARRGSRKLLPRQRNSSGSHRHTTRARVVERWSDRMRVGMARNAHSVMFARTEWCGHESIID